MILWPPAPGRSVICYSATCIWVQDHPWYSFVNVFAKSKVIRDSIYLLVVLLHIITATGKEYLSKETAENSNLL